MADFQFLQPLPALEAAIEQMDTGVVVVDEQMELLLINGAAVRTLGDAVSWVCGSSALRGVRVTAPDGRTRVRAADLPLQRVLRGESEASIAIMLHARGADPVHLDLTARSLDSRGGGAVLTLHDTTALQHREAARREAERRFKLTFEGAPVGMAMIDSSTRDPVFAQVNAVLCELVGTSPDGLLNSTLGDVVYAPDDEDALRLLLTGGGNSATTELRLRGPHGEPIWVRAQASLMNSGPGETRYAILHVDDIRVRRRYEEQLRHLADHDPLTDLLNRRRFREVIVGHTEICERYGPDGAIVLIDLDGFKDVNDTLGHGAGDDVLHGVARILLDRVRSTDVVARLGGDEFAVFLPKASAEDAQRLAREFVQLISAHAPGAAVSDRDAPRVGATAGVAMFAGPPLAVRDVLAEADVALYEAKESRRGDVALFEPAGQQRLIARRMRVTGAIRQALAEDGFRLLRQPIHDFAAEAVTGHELLLRMVDANGELSPPDRFLPVAEQMGVMPAIDRWVVGQAIAHLRESPGTGQLLVNLSAASLADDDLVEELAGRLRESGVDPSRIVLEVTETVAITHIDRARALAQRLQGLGCALALDDFGAGFASFYYLKHLPVDLVKIDGEFIRDLVSDTTSQAVVSALVQTAAAVGSRTIAECVEDSETFELLRSLGVDAAQGFFVGRPEPLSKLP